jgi:hypothetical protein
MATVPMGAFAHEPVLLKVVVEPAPDLAGRARRTLGPCSAARTVERRWVQDYAASALDKAGEDMVGEELILGSVLRDELEIARGGQPRVDGASGSRYFLPGLPETAQPPSSYHVG